MLKLRLLFIVGFMILVSPHSFSQMKMMKTKIADEIIMEIPESFIPMALSEQRLKYVTSKAPLAMFTNNNRSVDIGVNFASTPWQGELVILGEFYLANTRALYDSVNFLTNEIQEINGREFIVHEFEGYVFGKKDSFKGQRTLSKYIQILYTLYGNKVILFSFSSPLIEKDIWQPVAYELKNSIKIKK